MKGYCVKCRASREIKNAKSITMKNKRPATQGVCPVCDTKMITILMSTPCQGGMAFHLPIRVVRCAAL